MKKFICLFILTAVATIAQGAPAVMAAIGALGHELVEISNPVARQRRTTELAEKIALVNWEKGQHWEGIAGKFTPKGKFSLGGPKETAYAIYAAIGDGTTDAYRKVRDCKAAMQLA